MDRPADDLIFQLYVLEHRPAFPAGVEPRDVADPSELAIIVLVPVGPVRDPARQASIAATNRGYIQLSVAESSQHAREFVAQMLSCVQVFHVQKPALLREAYMRGQASLPPVSGHFSERHEACLGSDCVESEVGSEPRERLAEAAVQLGCEVADAELAKWAVEPIGQSRVVEVLTCQCANRKRVRRSPNPPESRPRRRDAVQWLRQPPAR